MHPNTPKPPPLRDQQTYYVATLFYKARRRAPHPDSRPHSPLDALPIATLGTLADGAAPTDNLEDYPLEPPTPGPDPLDNLYGAYISQSCLTDFFQTLANLVPKFSEALSTHRPLDGSAYPQVMEVEFAVPAASGASLETLRRNEAVSRFEREWNVEAVFQHRSVYRRHKRFAVFDMDSTLIQQEVIDEIASQLGPTFAEQVSAITTAAMNGELDFESSLRARCRLLAGVSSAVWEDIKPRIVLNHGAKDLVRVLKRLGYRTAVLSGGFVPLTGWLAGQLGLDYFHANHLVVSSDGRTLTGELEGEIVHAERKRQHVLDISEREGIRLEQVLVIGDGANDLPMMGVAGLGVAFNAKARVQLEAPARLNSQSLVDVLYLLGFTREEQDELMR